MKMLRLYDFDDYEQLPLTRWNIKQPNPDDERRENPMMTGDTDVTGFSLYLFYINDETFWIPSTDPLDLILLPGVAFTQNGGRMGHGMGYYDKYLHKYFNRFPDRRKINKTLLVGLGFREQIVDDDQLPLEPFDYLLDYVVTSDWGKFHFFTYLCSKLKSCSFWNYDEEKIVWKNFVTIKLNFSLISSKKVQSFYEIDPLEASEFEIQSFFWKI